MTLSEIKQAIANGKTVCYDNSPQYLVQQGKKELMITCQANGHAIGLTWNDGVTLNAPENSFSILGNK